MILRLMVVVVKQEAKYSQDKGAVLVGPAVLVLLPAQVLGIGPMELAIAVLVVRVLLKRKMATLEAITVLDRAGAVLPQAVRRRVLVRWVRYSPVGTKPHPLNLEPAMIVLYRMFCLGMPYLFFWGVLVIAQPHPCGSRALAQAVDSIVVGPVNEATAKNNRQWLESKQGMVNLPTGTIIVDQMPMFKSNVTFEGNGTTFRQIYTGGNFPMNCTVGASGTGFGHVHPFTKGTAADYIVVSAEVAANCPPQTLIYVWKNNGYQTPTGQLSQRRIVIARNGNILRLDRGVDPRTDVMKWFTQAVPIQDMDEGTAAVVFVSRISQPWPIGSTVMVTDGPSIANEANGEMRTVVVSSTIGIGLDQPVRRSYKQAAVAKMNTIDNVTLRNINIELPVNKDSECLYASKCRGWRIYNCQIKKTALGNVSDFIFFDCDLGWVQAAASSHNLLFASCRIQSITFEEGCHDNIIESSKLGPVPANTNVVSMRASSERLTIRNSHLLGGAFPCSQILFATPSRDCLFENITMTGNSPCWFNRGVTLRGVHSDGPMTFPN